MITPRISSEFHAQSESRPKPVVQTSAQVHPQPGFATLVTKRHASSKERIDLSRRNMKGRIARREDTGAVLANAADLTTGGYVRRDPAFAAESVSECSSYNAKRSAEKTVPEGLLPKHAVLSQRCQRQC